MRLPGMVMIAFVLLLGSSCAQETCPGETRGQAYSRIHTKQRYINKKAKPSLIFVSKSNNSHKRKPPK
jgi:hypothetical protein